MSSQFLRTTFWVVLLVLAFGQLQEAGHWAAIRNQFSQQVNPSDQL